MKTTSPIRKPSKADYRDAVCDLFAAVRANPSVLAAMKRPESVRTACDHLLLLVQRDVTPSGYTARAVKEVQS